MPDLLAAVYVLRLDDLARDHQTHSLAAAVRGQAPPDWDMVRAAFDADLAEPPPEALAERDQDRSTRRIKLRALGIAA